MLVIENFLRNLGLNQSEINIYLYLLSHGESIASIIAKRLDIKRSAAYATLESLEQKELVISFIKNDVKHFDAIDEEEVVKLCEVKVYEMSRLAKKAESLKEEMKKIRSKGKIPTLEVRGKIKYYQGLDAVTDLINETLEEKASEQLCFGLNTYHTEMAGDDWQEYTKKRVKKKMYVRSIQPDTDAAIEYKNRDKDEMRETLLIPKEEFSGGCEINIINDTIAMFTTEGKEAVGMKMKNKYMAQALKSLFKLAWKQAEKYK